MPPTTLTSRVFTYTRIDLSNSRILYVVNIPKITPKLSDYLDKSLGRLTYGRKTMPLSLVKKKILKFLSTKTSSHLETGAIAEFFVHLFLHNRGLKPQFIIDNLEENALKKGFDGFYVDSNIEWICESKSGSIKSKNVSHASKVKEAYKDLRDKLAGKDNNNPWQNAARHAKVITAKNSLIKQLEELSDEFDLGTFLEIKDCHIIPSGTIYLDGPWKDIDESELEDAIRTAIGKFQCKGLRVLCITKQSMSAFYSYLKS